MTGGPGRGWTQGHPQAGGAMRYLPLIWAGLWRKPVRTAFTLLSIMVAFILFGILSGIDAGFADLLARSDVISMHAPLTPATRGMLNAEAFGKMKKGVLIVNTGRGPLIDEPALIAALDSKQVGGAGLDVVTTEPLAKDSPLLGRDNVVLTPHTGFYSIEALEELQTKCATDVARVLSGEKAVYPISA